MRHNVTRFLFNPSIIVMTIVVALTFFVDIAFSFQTKPEPAQVVISSIVKNNRMGQMADGPVYDMLQKDAVWKVSRTRIFNGVETPDQDITLTVTHREGTEFRAILTINGAKVVGRGTIEGTVFKFATNRQGNVQQNFEGLCDGKKIQFLYQGSSGQGGIVEGAGELEFKAKR